MYVHPSSYYFGGLQGSRARAFCFGLKASSFKKSLVAVAALPGLFSYCCSFSGCQALREPLQPHSLLPQKCLAAVREQS